MENKMESQMTDPVGVQTELEFTEIEVNIPFFKIRERPFIGILISKEDRDEASPVILAEDSEGSRFHLGGYSIVQFFDNFYEKGKVCRITYIEKTKTNNGRSVNSFKFEVVK